MHDIKSRDKPSNGNLMKTQWQHPEFQEYSKEIVKLGLKKLNLSMGIVSRIKHNQYNIIAVESPLQLFKVGDTFPLQDTICQTVVDTQESFAFNSAKELARISHPAYGKIPLESYIASPIWLDDKIWGTLNFSSTDPRAEDFDLDDIRFVEYASSKIAVKITEFI